MAIYRHELLINEKSIYRWDSMIVLKYIQLTQDIRDVDMNDADSLLNALFIIEKFTCSAGLKLNKAKTKIFYLGNTNHKPIEDLIPCTGFKSLGIYFDADYSSMVINNLDEKYKKFQNNKHMVAA